MSVNEFLDNIERTAQVRNWNETDKISLLKLKLKGSGTLILNSNTGLKREDIAFEELRDIFEERFSIKQLDQFHYAALQNAMQHKNEFPETFTDRCK